MVEIVRHTDDNSYVRITPADVIFPEANAQKIADVFAYRVHEDTVIQTKLEAHTETSNVAKAGQWVVCNIGSVDTKKIPGYAEMSEAEKNLARIARAEQYVPPATEFVQLYKMDETLAKSVTAGNISYFPGKTASEPRRTATVPFNFVINAPWGDMFVKAGGVLVNSGNDIYGVDAAAFQNTYGTPGATQTFSESSKAKIMAGMPLVDTVVFSSKEVAEGYKLAASKITVLSK